MPAPKKRGSYSSNKSSTFSGSSKELLDELTPQPTLPKKKESQQLSNIEILKVGIATAIFTDVISRYGLAGACKRKYDIAKSLVNDGMTLMNMVDDLE